jgi:hypothetical protein
MRKWSHLFLVAAILVLAALSAAPGGAQAEVKLAALEVDLWPEYDRPSMLVIYRITLPATTALPVDLEVRIPAATGGPSAVAAEQTTAEGAPGLFDLTYTFETDGDWGVIQLKATSPQIQIEYYDPGLAKDGAARSFTYRWPGDYAVDALSIQVQQPTGAGNMLISPSFGQGVQGNNGLLLFNKQVGVMPAGQSFDVEIEYQKADDSLTVSGLDTQPSAPLTTTPGQDTFKAALPWILGGLGLVLIVGGGLWYWQSGKNRNGGRSPARRRHRPAAAREAAAAAEGTYCHQCGKRAAAGDRFCRACGAQLRLE